MKTPADLRWPDGRAYDATERLAYEAGWEAAMQHQLDSLPSDKILNDKIQDCARRGLLAYMLEWSEENYCAGWLDNLPAVMWLNAGNLYRNWVNVVGGTWNWSDTVHPNREIFMPGFHDKDFDQLCTHLREHCADCDAPPDRV